MFCSIGSFAPPVQSFFRLMPSDFFPDKKYYMTMDVVWLSCDQGVLGSVDLSNTPEKEQVATKLKSSRNIFMKNACPKTDCAL